MIPLAPVTYINPFHGDFPTIYTYSWKHDDCGISYPSQRHGNFDSVIYMTAEKKSPEVLTTHACHFEFFTSPLSKFAWWTGESSCCACANESYLAVKQSGSLQGARHGRVSGVHFSFLQTRKQSNPSSLCPDHPMIFPCPRWLDLEYFHVEISGSSYCYRGWEAVSHQ